jgi:hypothetical protein
VRLTCQACGAVISLDAALGHEGAREAVQIALQLPAPIGKLLVQYVALFRPPKRQLSMDRLASLLGELLKMVDAGKVERNGKIYAAPQPYWQQAIEHMLSMRDKLTLPLKSHGYLLEIIAGYADKAEAKAEQQAEERKRSGALPTGQTKSVKSSAAFNIGEHLKKLNQGGSDGNQA